MRWWVIVLIVIAVLAIANSNNSSSSSSSNGGGDESCIILVNGGNKLCGPDAAAWCDSTDSIRSDVLDDPDVAESQSVCDGIR